EDVDGAELGLGACERRRDLRRVRDVRDERQDTARRGAADVDRADAGTLGVETSRDRGTDTARAAGDERDAPGESIVVRPRHGTASLTGERGLRPGHRLPARLAPTRSGGDAFGPPARRRDTRRRA